MWLSAHLSDMPQSYLNRIYSNNLVIRGVWNGFFTLGLVSVHFFVSFFAKNAVSVSFGIGGYVCYFFVFFSIEAWCQLQKLSKIISTSIIQ